MCWLWGLHHAIYEPDGWFGFTRFCKYNDKELSKNNIEDENKYSSYTLACRQSAMRWSELLQ